MTLNGAIMQLVEMRENSLMPAFFKPYFDKVIETVSECEEPSAQPKIVRCKECEHYDDGLCRRWKYSHVTSEDSFCSGAERREERD